MKTKQIDRKSARYIYKRVMWLIRYLEFNLSRNDAKTTQRQEVISAINTSLSIIKLSHPEVYRAAETSRLTRIVCG